jgi:hypothetical protein
MTFGDLEHCVHEDILLLHEAPVAIEAEVSKLLNGLDHGDVFVVRRLAKDIAAGIAHELAFKSSEMVEVIRKLGAILELMIAWLERHGVNGRSLRSYQAVTARPRAALHWW